MLRGALPNLRCGGSLARVHGPRDPATRRLVGERLPAKRLGDLGEKERDTMRHFRRGRGGRRPLGDLGHAAGNQRVAVRGEKLMKHATKTTESPMSRQRETSGRNRSWSG